MNYEFHVGDYVETKYGVIGYISSVLATGDAWWMCVSDCHGYQAGQEYCIMHNGDFPHRYTRIGQYSFTKNDKIERINYADNFICERMKACDVAVMFKNKINELVDAVNELKKRNKECS